MEDFINKFSQVFGNLDMAKVTDLLSKGKVMQLKAGEHFAKAGNRFTKVGTIVEGLVRAYKVDDNGVEFTIAFAAEMEGIGTISNWKEDIPISENLQALEDTTLIVHERDYIREICINDPELARFYITMIEDRLFYAIERHDMFNMKSPEERYKWMLEREGNLINRVQQQMIVSCLGIIPSSLSRIKKRVMEENS